MYEDKAFKNFKSFTFVRHPFMRVVSTYKDKIIDWTNYRDWRKFVGFDKNQPYLVNQILYFLHFEKIRKLLNEYLCTLVVILKYGSEEKGS